MWRDVSQSSGNGESVGAVGASNVRMFLAFKGLDSFGRLRLFCLKQLNCLKPVCKKVYIYFPFLEMSTAVNAV